MNSETRELLGMLVKLNQAVPGLVLGVLDNSLTPAKQAAFGELLADAGQLLQQHAQQRVGVSTRAVGEREPARDQRGSRAGDRPPAGGSGVQ